jgi:NitT/TauT family transport system substrate-binding protein
MPIRSFYMAQEKEMRIGYLTTIYHTSFILRGSGRMENVGLNASWRRFPNGPALIEAFQRGDLDLGYIGIPPAMIGIGKGIKIKCVAGGHVEGTVLVGVQGYKSKGTVKDTLAQFEGRTIGTPRRGSIHDVILRKLTDDSRLSQKIKIENFDWAEFILDAMMEREIDGGCGTPPLAILARRQVEADVLLKPSEMWPFNPSYGITATERFIKNSPIALASFLRLHEDACNLLREKPKEAAELVHELMEIIGEDFAQEVIEVSPKYCASLPEEYIDSSMRFMPVLKDMGYLSMGLRREDVFYTKVIETVHPHKHHYHDNGL